jgi:hypothetical protein
VIALTLTLIAVACALGLPAPAVAASVLFNDSEFYTTLGPNNAIIISGDLSAPTPNPFSDPCVDVFGGYAADVYIVKHGSIDPTLRTALTSPPAATITSQAQGGLFTDEIIGYTSPTGHYGPGDWDIVLDRCTDGYYDPNQDYIAGLDVPAGTAPHGAFTVTVPADPNIRRLDLSALKATWQSEENHWLELTQAMIGAFQGVDLISQLVDIQKLFQTQAKFWLFNFLKTGIKAQTVYECAVAPVGATLDDIEQYISKCGNFGIGGSSSVSLGGIYSPLTLPSLKFSALRELLLQIKHYEALVADPPDPNINTFVTRGAASYAETSLADPLLSAEDGLANAVSVERTNSEALLAAVQKYEGAVQLQSDQGALQQAQSVQQYASLAAAQLQAQDHALSALTPALANTGLNIDGAESALQTYAQQVAAQGLPIDTVEYLHGLGVSQTDIAALRTTVAGLSTSSMAALTSAASAVQADDANQASQLQTLASDAQSAVGYLESNVTSPQPSVSAGGSYSGKVGSPVQFAAAATPAAEENGPLTYEWDLTGTGSFTDATGANPTYTYTGPFDGFVGVRVTDAAGNQGFAYAPIHIAPASSPPSVGAIQPGPVINLSPGTRQTFSAQVTANSPSYQWALDGTVVSTSPTFMTTFGSTAVGGHIVTLTVTDAGGSTQQMADIQVGDPVSLSSITVTPPAASLTPGLVGAAHAAAVFSDGSSMDVTGQVTWSSSDPLVATVDSMGNVTAVGPGQAAIAASVQGVTGTSQLTVPSAFGGVTLVGITLMPANANVAAGGQVQLRATGTYSDGSTADLTSSAQWSSASTNVASVSQGLVTGNQAGVSTITTTASGITATTNVYVASGSPSVTLSSIVVTPANWILPNGGHLAYRAIGIYSDGSAADLTGSVQWATHDHSVATIDAQGGLTAAGPGTTTVSATRDGVTGTTEATVPAQAASGGIGTFYVTENFNSAVAKVTLDAAGNATVLNGWATTLGEPDSIVFDHHGNAVVSNPYLGTLSLLDRNTGAILTNTINTTPLPIVADLALDPNSDSVFAIEYAGGGPYAIAKVSLTDGSTTALNPDSVASLGGVAVTANGARLFVSSHYGFVDELDPATGHVLRSVNIGGSPDGMTYDPTTGHVFVSTCGPGMCELAIGTDTNPTLTLVHSYNVTGDGIAADGQGHVYITYRCCLSELTVATGQVASVASGISSADDVAPVAGSGAPPGSGSTGPPPPSGTTIVYNGGTSGDVHDPAHLSATMTETGSGAPVVGAPVTLTVGLQSCSTLTGADGTASCTLKLEQPAGGVSASAAFAGSVSDEPVSTVAAFTVHAEESHLTISAPSSVIRGDLATFAATLTEDAGVPKVGQPLSIDVGTGSDAQRCSGITDGSGVATCTIADITLPGGEAPVTASFAGTDRDASAYAISTTNVKVPTTLIMSGDAGGEYHDAAHIGARLLDASTNSPITGAAVKLGAGSGSCDATTDSAGIATCPVAPTDTPGTYTATASYPGDASHEAATAQVPFGLMREQTVLENTTAPFFAAPGQAKLTGVLTEDGKTPIQGRQLKFTLGSGTGAPSCTATTGPDGSASCNVATSDSNVGPTRVTATFDGDPFYLPAQAAAASTGYAVPAAGGFVIGDSTAPRASGRFTFWGAQWSKANTLSGGASPASFKGFATNTQSPPTAGSAWTTTPGNSSQPPPSVPTYILVLVASHISQSGSTISGNVTRLAVLKTDPGYARNPGHPGTGTLLGFISR